MPATERRIPELDGLRGLAVLAVMLCHFALFWLPHTSPWVKLCFRGWIGVDLFFVLSGFLITGNLIDARGSRTFFRSFYSRRALRIVPIYYLTLAVVFTAASVTNGHLAHTLRGEQPWYWSFISNWHTAFGHTINILSHFWSLAIEEQFYIVWPLVVFLVPRHKLKWVCLAAVGVSLGLRNLPIVHAIARTHLDFPYRLTPFRLDGLAIGALVAVAVRDERLRLLAERLARPVFIISGAAAAWMLALSPLHVAPLMVRVGYTCLALVFGAGVYLAGTRPLPVLRWAPLVACGSYSYAMYVFHLPLSLVLSLLRAHIPAAKMMPGGVMVVFAMVCTFVLAWVSWHLLEKHCLKLKRLFPYEQTEPLPEPLRGAEAA